MTAVRAFYYDGKTSGRTEVSLVFEVPDTLRAVGDGVEIVYALHTAEVEPRIGNSPRRIRLPDGALFESADNDTIDEWLEEGGEHRASRALHRWESTPKLIVAALALTVLTIWLGFQYGVPILAKQVAKRLPPETEKLLAVEAMESLDKYVFKPSQLPAARQAQLRGLFAEMARNVAGKSPLKLELRNGDGVGPNAFALPSGIVVMTDELVKLAKHDEEIVAVLAHEIGHVQEHHSLRNVLQSSISALLMTVWIGDVSSVTVLGATLPTVLMQAKYSREFENEADDFALNYLTKQGIPPRRFADILRRIEEKHGGSSVPSILSTHPDTRERTKRFLPPGEQR